jgi:GST-like protein
MIDLYYWPTPNGWKVSIMLEETGLAYDVHPVHIGKGDQFRPEFLAISPNNRIPAIVDHDPATAEDLSIFESGAILVYLAEKSGCFLPMESHRRFDVLQWLFWQMGGLGPMAGQLGHFVNYAEVTIDYAIERYSNEYDRLLGVMDRRLAEREYLAGEYSIADMAAWPWVRSHERLQQPLEKFVNLQRWFDTIAARPAVQRGFNLGMDWWASRELDDRTRKILFNQTSTKVAELADRAADDGE